MSSLDTLPEALVDDFVNEIAAPKLTLQRDTHSGFVAGLEWLMPTAIVLFITQAYFSALLGELGKEHYKVLKRAAARLYEKASSLGFTRLGSPGKIREDESYSFAFSIMVPASGAMTLKLLIQPNLSKAEAEEAISAFLDLIESLFNGTTENEVIERLGRTPQVSRTLLLAYDFNSNRIEPVDPRS